MTRQSLHHYSGLYQDLSHLSMKERGKTNFDAPDSIDFIAIFFTL